MKRFIRLVCLILVFASLSAIPAYAQEQSPRVSNELSSYGAYCTMLSSTSVGVGYRVIGAGVVDEIGVNTVKIQYSSDKVNWTTAQTFRKANYSSMIAYNTGAHSGTLTATVPSGKYYRAYVEFYAAKDNGLSVRYYYTDII